MSMSVRSQTALTCFGILLSFSVNYAAADKVAWRTDLKKAAAASEATGKSMLLKFTAPWCGYCRKMSATTFRDERIVRRVNDCFIPVTVNADQNVRLKEALGIEGLPTTVVISPKFEVVKKIVGYQSAVNLEQQLKGLCPKPIAKSVSRTVVKPSPPIPAKTVRVRVKAEPAFGGFCLVSMLENRKLREGDNEHSLSFRGRRLVFASEEALKTFQRNPQKYWPGNDGNCIVSQRGYGKGKVGSPQFAAIFRNQIWFFAGLDERKAFAAKPSVFTVAKTKDRN